MEAQEDVPAEIKGRYYWMNVTCKNCGQSKSLAFMRGHRFDDHL